MNAPQIPPSWSRFVLHIRGGRSFGRDGRIRVNYFLDLLSACHLDEELFVARDLLAKKLGEGARKEEYTAIAAPKRGNILLMKEMGRVLSKKTICVRDSILFGCWIEGDIRLGEQVVLIDDVASDGEFLRDAVVTLRKIGVHTRGVWVLVDRPEGDSEALLAQEGVPFNFVFRMNDDQLEKLMGHSRR